MSALTLSVALLLLLTWFAAWPPLGGRAVVAAAERLSGLGRWGIDGMLLRMSDDGSDGDRENGGGKGAKSSARNYWKTRYAWWLNMSARASKMSAGLEFCALTALPLWVLLSLLMDFMIYGLIHVLPVGAWATVPWRLMVDCTAGLMVWTLYVIGKFNLRGFDDAPLWHGVIFCGALALICSFLSLNFMRGDMPIEIFATLVPPFLFWAFILWTVWTGLLGRYIKCVFKRNVGMQDFMDEIGAFGWGMPLGDRKSKNKGGIIGNIVDWVTRLVSLLVLAFMFMGLYIMYSILTSPDGQGLENIDIIMGPVLDLYIWLTD